MRRSLVLLLAVGVGVVLGRMFDGVSTAAEAGEGPPCAPLLVTQSGAVLQDMTGDGVLDPIAEAVRLLNWAFLGGPAPVAPCGGAGPSGIPDTGQTTCYDRFGIVVDCASDSCAGQDARYATGCSPDGRFVDNGDGTVTDNCTGLMWQKDTGNDGNGFQLCGALAYCENLELAGHTDWRLPNVRELQSIVDYGRYGPSIDPVFGALSSTCWSSTSYLNYPEGAWIVGFLGGHVTTDARYNVNLVRAVRSGP